MIGHTPCGVHLIIDLNGITGFHGLAPIHLGRTVELRANSFDIKPLIVGIR